MEVDLDGGGSSDEVAARPGSSYPSADRRARAESSSSDAVVKLELENGLTFVAERLATTRAVSMGVWVPIGSRDEDDAQAGRAHFIEHLVFKGTERRSALDIAREIDACGGDLNAFTTKELTCYYVRVLDEHLPLAVDLLADITSNATFEETEVETERAVVCEEIRASLDDTASSAHEFFNEVFWQGHPLGRPIAGTLESVANLDRATLLGAFQSHYGAGNMVVAAAGNCDPARLADMVLEGFGDLREAKRVRSQAPDPPRSVLAVQRRSSEEAHVFIGVPGLRRDDPRRFPLMYLNQILGGSMSSRLFQEVREKRGLAYSVYSFSDQYRECGCYGVYAATSADRARELLDVLRSEMSRMSTGEISQEEFDRARGHLLGAVVLGDEDPGAKMSRLGRTQIALGGPLSLEEVLAEIEGVTPDEVRDLAKSLLDGAASTTVVVGPFDEASGSRFLAGEEHFEYSEFSPS